MHANQLRNLGHQDTCVDHACAETLAASEVVIQMKRIVVARERGEACHVGVGHAEVDQHAPAGRELGHVCRHGGCHSGCCFRLNQGHELAHVLQPLYLCGGEPHPECGFDREDQ